MISWAESDRLLFLLALAAYALAACLAAGQLCRQGQRPYKMLRLAINSGFICNGTAIVTRTVESGHLPFANMYEFGLVFVFATVILSGIFARRYKANNLNAFIMPIVVILASTILISYHASRPLVPALKSYWLFIHVATAVAAYGALATACAVAIMYLWKYRLEKNEPNGETGCLSLSLEQMEMMAQARFICYALLNFADHYRGHMGRICMGKILAVGSQRNLVTDNLGYLCHLFAWPACSGVAGCKGHVVVSYRFYSRTHYFCRD